MEASEASKEILFFRQLMKEIDCEMSAPTVLFEDNQSCIAFSKNNTNHDRSKHIDIRAYALRDCVRDDVIKLVHVDTKNQLADMLTKHQQKSVFIKQVDKLFSGTGLCSPPRSCKKKVRLAHTPRACGCMSCFVNGA